MLHPLFLQQIEATAQKVRADKQKHPESYKTKNAAKRLKAILKLSFESIPTDPTNSIYRQGDTLGANFTHWFRAKFFQQYRLFFRFDQASKIIIYAWVNDDKTKRAYGRKTDAYAVFEKMLNAGNPPNSWAELEKACRDEEERRAKAGEPGSRELIEQANRE
jgi:toxin YhaV